MWPHSTPTQVAVQGYRMANCLWTVLLSCWTCIWLIWIEKGFTISLDYYLTLHWEDEKLARYKELRNEVHKRSGKRLYKLCNSQGGVFTKASQVWLDVVQVFVFFVWWSSLKQLLTSASFIFPPIVYCIDGSYCSSRICSRAIKAAGA